MICKMFLACKNFNRTSVETNVYMTFDLIHHTVGFGEYQSVNNKR